MFYRHLLFCHLFQVFSLAISSRFEYFDKDTTILQNTQGFSRMFLFEVPNWHLKGEFKASRSQFATLKNVLISQTVTLK